MTKEQFAQKISSRKFWAMLAMFVASLLIVFNVSDNDIAQITGCITAFGSIAVYMFSETQIDVARINAKTTQTIIETTESKTTQTQLSKDLNKEAAQQAAQLKAVK